MHTTFALSLLTMAVSAEIIKFGVLSDIHLSPLYRPDASIA